MWNLELVTESLSLLLPDKANWWDALVYSTLQTGHSIIFNILCFGGGRKKCRSKTFLLYRNGWSPCLNPFLGLTVFYFANMIPPLPAFSLRNKEHWVQMPLTYSPLSSVWGLIPNTSLLFSKEKGLLLPPKDGYLAHSAPPPPWNSPRALWCLSHSFLLVVLASFVQSFPCDIFHNSAWLFIAAKSLQSCPSLCDPIDGRPPGSTIPGILQARALEWVAISFSNAGKWKWKWSCSVVSNS